LKWERREPSREKKKGKRTEIHSLQNTIKSKGKEGHRAMTGKRDLQRERGKRDRSKGGTDGREEGKMFHPYLSGTKVPRIGILNKTNKTKKYYGGGR